jgi:hypothetical protein
MTRRPGVRACAVIGLMIAAIVTVLMPALTPAPAAAQIVDPNWSPPPTVYIPETGQTLDRLFLDLWRNGGGVYAYGNPITPEITLPNGHIVQYLEYARFEYWPEGDADGNYVVMGKIGAELRPALIPRKLKAVPGSNMTGGANALTAMSRAWLPLDAKSAQREITATWRYVPETKHSVRYGFKDFWEATGEAAYLGNPLTEEYILGGTTYQVFERGQLAWKKGKDPWMVPVGEVLAKRYGLDMSPQPQGDVPTYSEDLFVPPPAPIDTNAPPPPPGYDKAIVVSIGRQELWAYEGNTIVLSTLVSTGRPGFDTPTGLFFINTKLESQTMEGVIGGEYYNVPDVPWVMYFTDVGHALHGTYWHNNFGQVMSHGCVNLPMDVAEWMYGWAPIGTPVLIVDY